MNTLGKRDLKTLVFFNEKKKIVSLKCLCRFTLISCKSVHFFGRYVQTEKSFFMIDLDESRIWCFLSFFFNKNVSERNMLNLKKEMATNFWLNVRIEIKYVLWAPMTFFMHRNAHTHALIEAHIQRKNTQTFRQKHTVAQTRIQRYINTEIHIQKFRYKHTERRTHTYLERHASTKTHAHIFIYTQSFADRHAHTMGGLASHRQAHTHTDIVM